MNGLYLNTSSTQFISWLFVVAFSGKRRRTTMPEVHEELQGGELDAMRMELTSLLRESPLSHAASETRAVRMTVLKTLIASHGDSFGDGDQTPVIGSSCGGQMSDHPLRTAWASGLDYWEAILSEKHTMSIHRSAWQGDVEDIAHEIAVACSRQRQGDHNAMKRLLESRVSQMRLTPLHYACLGARRLQREELDSEAAYNLQTVVELLCAAGARVNARDIGGVTPLGLAAGQDGSLCSASLIPILLSHGADANIKSRFGDVPIMHCVVAKNLDAFRALLRAGARLNNINNGDDDGEVEEDGEDGISPAHFISADSTLTQIVMEHNLATHPSRRCASCDFHGATKQCAACRDVIYCSRDCQVAAWSAGHREACTRRYL